MALSNKTAKSLLDLEASAVLNLYRLYYDTANEPDNFFPFHNGTNGLNNGIIFAGVRYSPIAAEIDATETNIQQRINRPLIRISNENGQISSLLRRKDEFKNAKIVIIKTQVKYLDNENFDGNYNPYGVADPNAELSRETYVVAQKRGENKSMVELELTYPFDLDGFNIAGKTIISNYCPFQYRGRGCGYCGPPIAKDDDSSFSVPFNGNYDITSSRNLWVVDKQYAAGDGVYMENQKNPPKTWFVCKVSHLSTPNNSPNKSDGSFYWEKDECSKQISGCELRFTADQNNPCYKGYLRFGGYPGTHKYRFG